MNFSTRENNILDVFISSDPNMVNNVQCVGKFGNSDHVLVLAELNQMTCVAEYFREMLGWKTTNMDRIKDSLILIGNRNWKGETHFQVGIYLRNYFITVLTRIVREPA